MTFSETVEREREALNKTPISERLDTPLHTEKGYLFSSRFLLRGELAALATAEHKLFPRDTLRFIITKVRHTYFVYSMSGECYRGESISKTLKTAIDETNHREILTPLYLFLEWQISVRLKLARTDEVTLGVLKSFGYTRRVEAREIIPLIERAVENGNKELGHSWKWRGRRVLVGREKPLLDSEPFARDFFIRDENLSLFLEQSGVSVPHGRETLFRRPFGSLPLPYSSISIRECRICGEVHTFITLDTGEAEFFQLGEVDAFFKSHLLYKTKELKAFFRENGYFQVMFATPRPLGSFWRSLSKRVVMRSVRVTLSNHGSWFCREIKYRECVERAVERSLSNNKRLEKH